MFKKDDYIVLLKCRYLHSSSFLLNFCYKQKEDCKHLSVYDDALGGENGWGMHPYNKNEKNDWRYATPQEIEEYDRLGKPFNITTLKQEINYEIY